MVRDIIIFIIIGLIVGALARLVVPGKQKIGWAPTIIIGILGALIGGWITRALLNVDNKEGTIPWIAFIVSVLVGALGVMAYVAITRKNSTRQIH